MILLLAKVVSAQQFDMNTNDIRNNTVPILIKYKIHKHTAYLAYTEKNMSTGEIKNKSIPEQDEYLNCIYSFYQEKFYSSKIALKMPGKSLGILFDGQKTYMTASKNPLDQKSEYISATEMKSQENPGFTPISYSYKFRNSWYIDLINDKKIIKIETFPKNDDLIMHYYGIVRKSTIDVFLSRNNNYMAVKCVCISNNRRYEYNVTKVLRYENFVLPISCTLDTYLKSTKISSENIEILPSDVKSDKDLSFLPNVKTSGTIYNQDENIVYKIGKNGLRIEDASYKNPLKSKNSIYGWLMIISLSTIIMISIRSFIKWKVSRNP